MGVGEERMADQDRDRQTRGYRKKEEPSDNALLPVNEGESPRGLAHSLP